MNNYNLVSIVFLSILYCCFSINPRKMNNYGDNPTSVVLNNDKIFTITSIGVLLSSNDGSFISNRFHRNTTSSKVALTKFPNGSVVSYNAAEVSFYSRDGSYKTQSSLVLGSSPTLMDFTTILYYDDTTFLIAMIDNNELKVYLIDANTANIINSDKTILYLPRNVQCVKQVIGNGFICFVIELYNPEILSCYTIELNLDITIQGTAIASDGRYLKVKYLENNLSAVCYLTFRADAYCCIFDESQMIITYPFLIASSTDNFNIDRFDMGVLSKKELIFVYIDNDNSQITAQRLSYYAEPIGNIYSFPMTGSGYLNKVNYLMFSSGKIGVVYGKSGEELYFQEINIPTCRDFCQSVGFSVSTPFDLDLYCSTIKIQFTHLPVFGTILSQGLPVLQNIDYLTTNLEFSSLDIPAIGSSKFRAVNENGLSSECLINIFIGDKVNCHCPNTLYGFQDTCVSQCPNYTYTDIANKICFNCASLGKYLYLGECKNKDELVESVFVSNSNYNVVEDCNSPCKSCVDLATNCLSCIPGNACSLTCINDYIYSVDQGKCVPCYESCLTCSQLGDINQHHCLTCKPGYKSLLNKPNQCFISCRDTSTSRWFLDENDYYYCNSSTVCPSFRPIYIIEDNQCVESCSKTSTCIKCQQTTHLLFKSQDTCVAKCPSGYFGNEKTHECDKMLDIDIEITDKPLEDQLDDLNSTITPNKNTTTIIIGDNYTVEIYNSTEKGGNLALSQIDFSKCEKVLRKYYTIPDGDIIIFVKIDIERTNELTNQVEYLVYDNKRNKLDLSLCDNTTVDITYYIKNASGIDVDTAKYYEQLGIDIYNPNDPFFVDICFPFTTANGTDIILRERLKDIYKNISLCEESCSYKGIDLHNLTVTCTCTIKQEVHSEITPNFFTQTMKSVFTNSNFMVVTCYNLVFNKDILLINIGFWFYSVLMMLHLPNWLYFFIVGVTPISNHVYYLPKSSPNKGSRKGDDYISTIIEEGNTVNEENNDIVKFRESRRNSLMSITTNNNLSGVKGDLKVYSPNRHRKSRFLTEESVNELPQLEKKRAQHRNSQETQLILQDLNSDSNYHQAISQTEKNEGEFNEKIVISPCFQSKRLNLKLFKNHEEDDRNMEKKMSNGSNNINNPHELHSDKMQLTTKTETNKTTFTQMSMNTELNLNTVGSVMNKKSNKKASMETLDDFIFKEALLYDKRSFFRQLYICIKNKHSFLVTFFKRCLLELRCILIIVYIFENCIDFAFNAFFFTDNLISKRYNYEGNLYFLFTLQTNFISSLASFFASLVVCFLLNLLTTSKNRLEYIISDIKQNNLRKQLLDKSLKCLKIKLAFYLILELLFILFFWYYVAAFCAVYQSSQWSWFTGGCMSFALGLLFPILICLFITTLRYLALEHKKECLFKLAQWCFRF